MSQYSNLFSDIKPVFYDYPKFDSAVQIVLYGFIYGMTFNGNGECQIPNQVLADKCKVTRQGLSKNINILIERGLISKIKHSGNCVGYKALVTEKEMEQDMKRLIAVKPQQTTLQQNVDKLENTLGDINITNLFLEWSDIARVKIGNNKRNSIPKSTTKSFLGNCVIKKALNELSKLSADDKVKILKLCIDKQWATISSEMLNNNKQLSSKPNSQSINRGDVNYDD